jgi:hypothetical protein
MRKIWLFLALLGGCAQQPVYQPVDISVPLTVPCKAATVKPPAWVLPSIPPAASLFDKTKAVLADLDLHKAYEAELEAEVKACE